MLQTNNDPNTLADALWGLGKLETMAGNYPLALENLRALTENYPTSSHSALGWFLLGENYFDLERYQESVDAFSRYMQMRPGILDAYAQERRGDALANLGQYQEALNAYQAALQATGQTDPNVLAVKIANTYAAAGDNKTALQLYDNIFNATSNDYLKAEIDLLAGRAYLNMGQTGEAYKRWQHTVSNYPLASDSYFALVGLVDAGQTVDEFERGLVDYYAGQYDVALQAFDRYLAAKPDHDGTALYYRALTLRELGDYEAAITTWDKFILGYQSNRYWATAWDEKAYTQWAYLKQYRAAAKTLEDFVMAIPGSPSAVTYLMSAARIYERNGDLKQAAELWESISAKYPSDAAVVDALFLGGITRYRLGEHAAALEDFQRGLLLTSDTSQRARAYFWIGKSYLAAGDKANATLAWQQGQAVDTVDYYSIRARDLLNNRKVFESAPSYNLAIDLETERKEAAAWVRVRFNLPPETDLTGPGALADDPRMQRGQEFWELGMFDQARVEFESLRKSVESDAVNSFRLGNTLLDLGAYRPGIFAIRQVLTLAGLDEHAESLNTPAYFRHIRYGLYYRDLIFPVAQENGFDPLFITSLIRQESLFEGFVRSPAGARGLMQIIPVTGASIAEQMGWPADYSDEDLYSPYVSVRMGTFYLNNNRRLFDGDIYAALAAYNGGPGNASVWLDLSQGDPDLFLEIIRYGETRDYIRHIYETFTIYRSIYSPMQ